MSELTEVKEKLRQARPVIDNYRLAISEREEAIEQCRIIISKTYDEIAEIEKNFEGLTNES